MNNESKVNCPICNKERDWDGFWIKQYGRCSNCQAEKESKDECERAVKNGEGTSDNQIICPHCGHSIEDELYEYESGSETCDECGKEYELDVEHSATYTTTKKED